MASPTRTLTVNFVGRDKNLQKSFKRVSKGSQLMSDKLMKATRMAGIGFSALGGVAVGAAMALKPMVDKAADVEESLSKNQLMFGEASAAVERFAETSLNAFGVTRREALQATGTFGSLGKAMGMTEADSAKMATSLVGLAGDLSSLENVRVDEALTALRAGIIGEAEPLRRLGILLDAATIKTKALELGLIKSTKEALTPAVKSQAAYALILEKGAVAMGDFNRTSDSAVNQQKRLSGAWDDIQVQIGEKLLPAFTRLVTWANNELVPAFQKIVDFDWSELTFEDLEDALIEAEKELIKVTAKIGVNIGESILDGMKSSWEKDTEEGGLLLAFGQKLRGFAVGAAGPLGALLDNILEEWLGDKLFPTDDDGDGPATRGPGSRGGRGGAAGDAASQTDMLVIIAQLEAAAAAAAKAAEAAAAEPMAGLSEAEIEVMISNAAARAAADALAAAAAAAAVDEAFSEAFVEPSKEGSAAAADAAAAAAAQATGADQKFFDDVVGPSKDWDNFLKAMASGGPPNTQITINSTAVSGQEVVDAIGAHVDLNGPLPPHWQQSAN